MTPTRPSNLLPDYAQNPKYEQFNLVKVAPKCVKSTDHGQNLHQHAKFQAIPPMRSQENTKSQIIPFTNFPGNDRKPLWTDKYTDENTLARCQSSVGYPASN